MLGRVAWVMSVTVALGLCAGGCGGSDDPAGSGGSSGSGGTAGTGGSGGSGGGVSDHPCQPKEASCYVAGTSGPGAQCMARRDNSKEDVIQLRVTQLELKEPATLRQPFLQNSVITPKITPNSPECFQFGDAQFNILFSWDTTTMKVTQGAGEPQALIGPLNDGTCYSQFNDGPSGAQIKPVETDFTVEGNVYTAVFPDIAVPIYLEDSKANYALLPLHELEVTATLSDDKSCVGRYVPENLDETQGCSAKEGEFAYQNAGTYKGYVTVEEADTVDITSLGYSLCVLLSGNVKRWQNKPAGETIGRCDGSQGFMEEGGFPKGNWCSGTNSAATDTCADAWLIESDYAAAGVTINGVCGG
ncbi:MAG: hypothetical protein R3B07_24795 [Polyangiaceae bacterium]